MRHIHRLAFALFVVASVPMILGNPVIAADFNADLRGDAAAISLAVTLGYPESESSLRETIGGAVRSVLAGRLSLGG
ncbi:MAG: hypothetical protein J7494_00310 [Sphingobium sp.]|nr:hypothetical protein [Sphingobium sp.]